MHYCTWVMMSVMSLSAAFAADFYVSPQGNDDWSGTTAVVSGNDGPFATLARAQVAVRSVAAQAQRTSAIVVEIADGRYALSTAWTMTAADSGTEKTPIIYQAAAGATPIISGGRLVTGWQVGSDGRWTTTIPGVDKGFYPRQLTIGGERRYRPRLPKKDWYVIAGFAGADPHAEYTTPADKFEFKPGDIHAQWKNITDIEVTALHFWVDVHLPVAAIDDSTHIVSFAKKSRRKLTDDHTTKGARYYIDNVAEALSEPGEWYLDRPSATLTYIPKPGETIESAQAVVPVSDQLLSIAGTVDKPLSHISFRGITWSDTYWTLPANDAGDLQAACSVPGAIVISHAHHISFEDCRFINLGTYGIEFGHGAFDGRIIHNEFAHLAAGAVKLNGGNASAPASMRCGRHIISDNHMHHLGELFHSAVGILSQHSFSNNFSHNHIHHLYYTGISAGWVWGYGDSVSRDNIIEGNDIHDVGQRMLSDMGGIYMLGKQPGTIVRGNRIHDVDAWSYGGWGIYTDEGSSDIVIENNLVYRTKSGGFHQHYGKDNMVRNNIIALCRNDQIQRTRMEKHRSFTFERNIVYFKPGMNVLGSNWNDDQFVMNHNCYWQVGGGDFKLSQWSWAEWQQRGFDRQSIIADPLFVDPENGDFTLQANSPALEKLGFQPLNMQAVGPRQRTK